MLWRGLKLELDLQLEPTITSRRIPASEAEPPDCRKRLAEKRRIQVSNRSTKVGSVENIPRGYREFERVFTIVAAASTTTPAATKGTAKSSAAPPSTVCRIVVISTASFSEPECFGRAHINDEKLRRRTVISRNCLAKIGNSRTITKICTQAKCIAAGKQLPKCRTLGEKRVTVFIYVDVVLQTVATGALCAVEEICQVVRHASAVHS